jgi:indolepyruvate ferredoxin oxidoreductase
VVAGVGGTGVITIGQLLGMAGHIEGKGIVTQDAAGLAQKGGATWSHVLIGDAPRTSAPPRQHGGRDLIIGCDPIVTAGKETVLRMRAGRTHVALNSHSTPTAAFVKNANWHNPSDACAGEIVHAVGPDGVSALRCRRWRDQADGRQHLHQPDDAGLRLAEGLDPARPRVADARDRAQCGGRGQQQGRLRVGPPRARTTGLGREAAGTGAR